MKLKLTTATPLHVGNGQTLSPYSDYVVGDDGKVYLINNQKLNDQLAQLGEKAIDQFVSLVMGSMRTSDTFSLKSFLEKYKIDYKKIAKFSWKTNAAIKNEEIHATIKTASRAYVPGSSIKGAVRTALLYFHRKEEGYNLEKAMVDIYGKRGAKNPIGEDVFGAHDKDVFKFLHVSDTSTLSPDEVGLVKTYTYDLAKKEATIPITKEVIPENKHLYFGLHSKARKEHNLPAKFHYLNEDNEYTGERFVLSRVNQFYLQLLESELSLLKKLNNAQIKPLLQVYEQLYKTAEKYDQEKNGAVIRLGSGKTFLDNTIISLFSQEERTKLFKKMNMAGGSLFPKTRKMIESGSVYDSVLGWAYLEPVDELSGEQS